MKTEQPGGYVAQRDCSGLALVRGYRKGATPEARPYRPVIGSSAKAQEGDAPLCSAVATKRASSWLTRAAWRDSAPGALEQAVPTATRSGEVCELAGPRSTSIRSCESILPTA